MVIKVCGMKEAENIRAVSQADIQWMGFIFYPKSTRYYTAPSIDLPERTRGGIAGTMPGSTSFGCGDYQSDSYCEERRFAPDGRVYGLRGLFPVRYEMSGIRRLRKTLRLVFTRKLSRGDSFLVEWRTGSGLLGSVKRFSSPEMYGRRLE